jgi:hypothetical protein
MRSSLPFDLLDILKKNHIIYLYYSAFKYHKKPIVSRFPKQKVNGMHKKEKINYLDNNVNLGEKFRIDCGLSFHVFPKKE